jgi:hypothetical protein
MTGSTVFAIDQHTSWRGTNTPQVGLFRRIAKFSSDARLVLKYLLADGSLNIQFQKDCLLISRKTSPPIFTLESENQDRALSFTVRPSA